MVSVILNAQLRSVEEQSYEVLADDVSGHDADHVRRVYGMAMRFADELPEADRNVVALAAWLHDVDDYKLVGKERAESLSGATEIMQSAGIGSEVQASVRGIIQSMSYSKSLRGIRPTTLEGKIVSDADMCDAIGAIGTVRCLQYAMSDKGSGVVFDPEVWPNVDITAEVYSSRDAHTTNSFVNHHFEKLLKISGMMLTEPGRKEAAIRDRAMVDFMREFFREYERPEWQEFLEKYLSLR